MSFNSVASTEPVVRGKCQSHNSAKCTGWSVADCLSPLLVISVKFTVSSEFTVFNYLRPQLWLSLLQMWSWWDDDVVMTDCQWRSSLLQVAALWTALWKFWKVWITKIIVRWAQFKSTSCYIPSSSNTWQYSSVLFITQSLYKNMWYRS